jgi:hypothetical protein
MKKRTDRTVLTEASKQWIETTKNIIWTFINDNFIVADQIWNILKPEVKLYYYAIILSEETVHIFGFYIRL